MAHKKLRSDGQNNPMPLTRDEIKSLLEELSVSLTANFKLELENQTNALRDIIDSQVETINTLKSTVVKQAVAIDRLEGINRREHAIISGLSEENSANDTLTNFIQQLDVQLDETFKPIRLGTLKNGTKSRPLKVKFRSENDKLRAIEKSRNLIRSDPQAAKIYVNFDESPLRRLENARLRQAKNDLIKKNPNKNVQIRKGKLFLENVEVDHFDITKQVF